MFESIKKKKKRKWSKGFYNQGHKLGKIADQAKFSIIY